MTRTNLVEMAEEWVDLSLSDVFMNTQAAAEYFGVDVDSQMPQLKRNAKKYAKVNLGKGFGYDPGIRAFRVPPDNARSIAQRMYHYQMDHIASQIDSETVNFVLGLEDQGYLPKEESEGSVKGLRNAARRIRNIARDTKFTGEDDES